MAKTMARIRDGIVVNIEWCSYETEQTDNLIDIENRSVSIGNKYVNGKFYNENDSEILTDLEIAQNNLNEYTEALLELGVEL